MRSHGLSIAEVVPRKARTRWHTFGPSDQFRSPWWEPTRENPPTAHWLLFQLDEVEAARCKFDLIATPRSTPTLGNMPEGQLDILAFEVASSMRRRGVGRAALHLIRACYPGPRLTALNDNTGSQRFWDGMGWIRHEPTHPFLQGGERVTYSEQ